MGIREAPIISVSDQLKGRPRAEHDPAPTRAAQLRAYPKKAEPCTDRGGMEDRGAHAERTSKGQLLDSGRCAEK
eukprot:9051176-Pyramimonas_sp.AAC.1